MKKINKSVSFSTLGCRVNQYESQALKEQFEKRGYSVLEDGEAADIFVINTCTVTNMADRKSRQLISKAKKANSDALIAVIGCYPERDGGVVESMEDVDIVVGTSDKSSLIDRIENVEYVGVPAGTYDEIGAITSMASRTRAYVKVEDGCDRYCAYCAIPYARGPVRSRPMASIRDEVASLVKNGTKEIVLTGINTALYGYDFDRESYGVHLILEELEELDGVEDDFRIRVGSLEPTVITSDYVKRLLEFERLCPQLHLSLQSGSDAILKAMGRRYTMHNYLRIVETLKRHDSLFGITTDIIAGFPGESKEHFQESLSAIKAVGFSKVHAFPYSQRSGTKAASMEGQLKKAIKRERAKQLIEVGEAVGRDFLIRNIGSSRRVLSERIDDGYLEGLSDNGIKVYAQGDRINMFNDRRLLEPFSDGMLGD